jgi:thioredoxin reductase
MQPNRVVVIGAGPYGLSAAAHLRAAGVEIRVFGGVMDFWERQMPIGMVLRSEWEGSHFSDPAGAFGLDAFERATNQSLPDRIPLAEFVRYGQWFQQQAVPEVDSRRVTLVEPLGDGFRVRLEDGESVLARRVVVATGLASFASRPEPYVGLPVELVSHTCEERDLSRFNGKRVAVIGAGQSALECAALLTEGGAKVEVLTRRPIVHWLAQSGRNSRESGRLEHLLYPPGAVGPLGINWIVQLPELYRALPRKFQDRVAVRALRPAGSGWLRSRLADVPISTGAAVTSATPHGNGIRLALSDGSTREVDHVLIGVGYRIDVDRYLFLDPALRRAIDRRDAHPELGAGFESSVRGLHFLGAASMPSYGPLMRFVAGTGFAAKELTRRVMAGEKGRSSQQVEMTLPRLDRTQTADRT